MKKNNEDIKQHLPANEKLVGDKKAAIELYTLLRDDWQELIREEKKNGGNSFEFNFSELQMMIITQEFTLKTAKLIGALPYLEKEQKDVMCEIIKYYKEILKVFIGMLESIKNGVMCKECGVVNVPKAGEICNRCFYQMELPHPPLPSSEPCDTFEDGTMEECYQLLQSGSWNIGELQCLLINVTLRIGWLERDGERKHNKHESYKDKFDQIERRLSELER